MFSYSLYKVVHIVGLVLLTAGLGGIALNASAPRFGGPVVRPRLAYVFHGLGLFLILLGGFGMMARIGISQGSNWPGWLWTKVLLWVVLGAAVSLPYRFPKTARPLLLLLPVLGGLAAYMAIYKPI